MKRDFWEVFGSTIQQDDAQQKLDAQKIRDIAFEKKLSQMRFQNEMNNILMNEAKKSLEIFENMTKPLKKRKYKK